ncbi:MAG TPA: SLC13 family permease [Longimicrobiales bacterium]
MSWDAWLTLAVVTLMVAALARDVVAPVLAVLGADIVLLVTGVIPAESAFSGFANPAPITVAALFIVARAVEKTGALQPLIARTLGHRKAGRGALLRLLAPVAGASAFLNNTPIVAMLAPQVADWAEKRGRSTSPFLMPLSFATILGGMVTLIGTSTNLLVSGLMEAAGMAPLGMFEITRVGLPIALAGVVLLVALAPVLLPERRNARRQFEEDVREYVMSTVVAHGGPLDGQTVEAGGLRHLQGVFLAEIERDGQMIAPATPATLLRGGDRLTFVGRVDLVRDLQNLRGLVSTEHRHALGFDSADHTFFEAVVSGASPLVGKTLKEIQFRSRYQAAVVAIHRAGARVHAKLGTVRLKEGDTLLLVSDSEFGHRWRDRSDFLLVSHLGGTPPPSSRQALVVGLVTLGIVALSGFGLLPILHAALIGAFTLLAARVLTPGEARGAVNLDVVLIIGASFGIGAAVEHSGLAAVIANGVIQAARAWGPGGVLVSITIATIALTELITNAAAAALIFPIALATAGQMGLDARPFAIAVAIAASASFLTPIGYQTNTMVYGLGGYRFGDYARLGTPLTILVILAILLLVPVFWPLAAP